MITLEPLGGLANRMRVIDSGLWLMKESNQELQVIWNLNKELNCDFHILFKPIKGVTIIKKERKYFYAHHTNNKILYKKLKAFFRNRLLGIDYHINEVDFLTGILTNEKSIEKIARNYKNIYIKTTQKFGNTDREIMDFVPSALLHKIINEQTSKFNSNTIGIHIRRTDNQLSILKSPLSLFIDKIEKEVKCNNTINFYLATDDIEVEKELIDKFGSLIIVREKVLNRNKEEGIIDALIDLYCLSKTNYIYGSYWSSFSQIAAALGGIELKVLRNI